MGTSSLEATSSKDAMELVSQCDVSVVDQVVRLLAGHRDVWVNMNTVGLTQFVCVDLEIIPFLICHLNYDL